MRYERGLFILAQIVGVLIIVINAFGAFQKKKENLFFYNAMTNMLCALQYFLLGAYTGIICCVIATLRNVIFSRFKKGVPIYIFIIYAIIMISVNVPFIHRVLDICPIMNVLLFSFMLCQNNMNNIKKSFIFTGIVGIIYDFNNKAYSGMILNLTDLIGGIKGTIDSMKRKKLKDS